MWPKRLLLVSIGAMAATLQSSCVLPPADNGYNGITVDVKIYDSHALQEDINTLSDKLGNVSLIDQASLIAHLGALQGATSSQFAMNLQASGIGSPSVATTTTNGTPSIAQVLGGTTTSGTAGSQVTQGGTTPAAGQTITTTPGTTTSNNNQTTTTTPSNTTQTVTTTPSVTPTIPTVSSIPALATPSAPSQSTLDLLGEQMQASYQILGLRAMLRGAQSDEYTADNQAMRHVTYGFPISVSTPRRYDNKAAEIEISVCNPKEVLQNIPPSLGLMLPQEKTYNVASMVSSSVGLGAGAVIAGVVNIGANFSWTHQTFYLVKQQDTVSLRRDRADGASPCAQGAPTTFSWQFRPVLGQKTIDQGPRMTYAQLSFQPSAESGTVTTVVRVRSCWREYDADTGIVGRRIEKSCVSKTDSITSAFDTLPIRSVDTIDNGNGTLTTTVHGHFLPGTRVGLGEAYLDESIPGFENSGAYIRFTSTAQVLAVRGARLVSPDGSIKDVIVTDGDVEPINYHAAEDRKWYIAPGRFQGSPQLSVDDYPLRTENELIVRQLKFEPPEGAEVSWRSKLTLQRVLHPGAPPMRCIVPYANSEAHPATIAPFSDTLLEISLPIWQCLEIGTLRAPPPYVVVMGGKAFGFSDAPFRSITDNRITFLVPSTFVQGLTSLELKRLFVDNQYSFTYNLKPSGVAVTGIGLVGTTKVGATFLVTGSGLQHAHLIYPDRPVHWRDTYGLITLTADEIASVKTLFLKADDGSAPPFAITLPSVKLVDSDADNNKVKYSIVILEKTDASTTYLVTAIPEALSLKGATLKELTPLSTAALDDRHLQFALGKADVAAYKQILIQLKDGPLLPLTLPTPKADDSGSATKDLTLQKDDKGITKGYTGSYSIKGSGLSQIADVRYQHASLTYHLAPDASSVSIDLPATFAANSGLVPLLIVPTKGDQQVYEVPVK